MTDPQQAGKRRPTNRCVVCGKHRDYYGPDELPYCAACRTPESSGPSGDPAADFARQVLALSRSRAFNLPGIMAVPHPFPGAEFMTMESGAYREKYPPVDGLKADLEQAIEQLLGELGDGR
jgi:hypothetical protein